MGILHTKVLQSCQEMLILYIGMEKLQFNRMASVGLVIVQYGTYSHVGKCCSFRQEEISLIYYVDMGIFGNQYWHCLV